MAGNSPGCGNSATPGLGGSRAQFSGSPTPQQAVALVTSTRLSLQLPLGCNSVGSRPCHTPGVHWPQSILTKFLHQNSHLSQNTPFPDVRFKIKQTQVSQRRENYFCSNVLWGDLKRGGKPMPQDVTQVESRRGSDEDLQHIHLGRLRTGYRRVQSHEPRNKPTEQWRTSASVFSADPTLRLAYGSSSKRNSIPTFTGRLTRQTHFVYLLLLPPQNNTRRALPLLPLCRRGMRAWRAKSEVLGVTSHREEQGPSQARLLSSCTSRGPTTR